MLTSYQTFVETEVPKEQLIISRTNLRGIITYANDVFAQISGYSVDELVGQPHNIVRHPDMPRSIFENLWKSIKNENIWKGYVKNLRRDGGYYWVYAEVSGVYKDDKLVEYKSMRTPIDTSTKEIFQKRYDTLRAKEEGVMRFVSNIPVDIIDKIRNLAKQENKSEDKVLSEILEGHLL